ncbi:hypothetical protein BBO99_00009198 [Phytophthora kernoviae]|uniref:Acyltransferase 3 domain-containing protein n=1 Tax=Phytophthora kernoviae TaxID=325452 RepID=A0A3R7H072_9STRA|nr:hypothetical protein BBI17_009248 [Phytophthora kernoviae]RLN73876.1 hypothetical protein BBO99_00009198 [Phytophthora kernoviae]
MYDIFIGDVGVDAFFVLSSLLLTMIFMKKSIKLLVEGTSYRKWAYTLADYFSKRFFRVYPLFALLLIALWLMPFEYKHQFYKVNKPGDFNLFLTLIFYPEHQRILMWTLPLEISCYFVLSALVLSVVYIQPIEEQVNDYDRTISEFGLMILLATVRGMRMSRYAARSFGEKQHKLSACQC